MRYAYSWVDGSFMSLANKNHHGPFSEPLTG